MGGQALLKGGEFMTGRIVRDSERTFTDLHTEVHGFAPAESGESPPTCAAAIWQTFCGAPLLPADHTDDKPCRNSGAGLADFDVLCLCDTSMQWYFDVDGHKLEVEDRLRSLCKGYRRGIFLGASAGGFGALSQQTLGCNRTSPKPLLVVRVLSIMFLVTTTCFTHGGFGCLLVPSW